MTLKHVYTASSHASNLCSWLLRRIPSEVEPFLSSLNITELFPPSYSSATPTAFSSCTDRRQRMFFFHHCCSWMMVKSIVNLMLLRVSSHAHRSLICGVYRMRFRIRPGNGAEHGNGRTASAKAKVAPGPGYHKAREGGTPSSIFERVHNVQFLFLCFGYRRTWPKWHPL